MEGHVTAKGPKVGECSVKPQYGCFHEDTELLTTKGSQRISELKINDEIAVWDAAASTMTFEALIGWWIAPAAEADAGCDEAQKVQEFTKISYEGGSFAVTPKHYVEIKCRNQSQSQAEEVSVVANLCALSATEVRVGDEIPVWDDQAQAMTYGSVLSVDTVSGGHIYLPITRLGVTFGLVLSGGAIVPTDGELKWSYGGDETKHFAASRTVAHTVNNILTQSLEFARGLPSGKKLLDPWLARMLAPEQAIAEPYAKCYQTVHLQNAIVLVVEKSPDIISNLWGGGSPRDAFVATLVKAQGFLSLLNLFGTGEPTMAKTDRDVHFTMPDIPGANTVIAAHEHLYDWLASFAPISANCEACKQCVQ